MRSYKTQIKILANTGLAQLDFEQRGLGIEEVLFPLPGMVTLLVFIFNFAVKPRLVTVDEM